MSLEKVPSFIEDLFEAEMSGDETGVYRFKSFRLNVSERQLVDGDRSVPLTPKAFDVLVHLVRNAGHLVGKDELMDAVWSDSFVEPNNLPRTIHTLRTALGQRENGEIYIETVPKKGYRFLAEVEVSWPRRPDEDSVESVTKTGSTLPFYSGRIKLVYILAGLLFLSALATGWYSGAIRQFSNASKPGSEQSLNGQAFNHYRQGKFLIDRKLIRDRDAALNEFERAIALDPNYAAAYAGKADAKYAKFWASGYHDDVVQARAAAVKAASIDPDSSYAYTILCRIKYTYDWDFRAAENDCRRAISIDPENADAHHELAMGLISTGREAEALAEIETAISLLPTSFNKGQKGLILYFSRRFDEAIQQIEQVKATDPEFGHSVHWLAVAYENKRDYGNALRVYLDLHSNRLGPEVTRKLRKLYEDGGWQGVLPEMISTTISNNSNPPTLAASYCQLGEKEKAFELLKKGFEQRSLWMAHILMEPRFDPCRDDPRFAEFLKRVYGN